MVFRIVRDLFTSYDYSKEDSELTEFSPYYLHKLGELFVSYRKYFNVIIFFFCIALLVQIVGLFSILFGSTSSVTVSFFGTLVSILFTLFGSWFFALCRNLANLLYLKNRNDVHNTLYFREKAISMSETILKKAEEKAETMITAQGDNIVLAIGGSTISNVSQNKQTDGSEELLKSWALMISYCQESENGVAVAKAEAFVTEASSDNPSKSKLFDYWSSVSTLVPGILNVVKVVDAVKKVIT